MSDVRLLPGDCREVIKTLADDSVDAVVCDPPYSLQTINKRFAKVGRNDKTWTKSGPHQRTARGFMNKTWDTGEVAHDSAWWAEVYRVLKPGAHLVAFGGTRTYHRLACSIEDAGFEIRDMIAWQFGVGFPKSHSVSKAILPKLEDRYGKSKCDCLDAGNGKPSGHDAGCRDRKTVRVFGVTSESASENARNTELSVQASASQDGLRELRCADGPQTPRPDSLEKTLLLNDMRGIGAEAAGCGAVEIRSGMEEPPDQDQDARQSLPRMRKDPGAEWHGAACASPEAISGRRHQPSGKSGRPLRDPSSPDREGHRASDSLDPDRREPRRIVSDDLCGWEAAMAAVCSWCGLPAREWLTGIGELGTALKPALEPICLARKPLSEKTVAANVLRWGTGALNIDGCRIAGETPSVDLRAGGKAPSSCKPGEYGDGHAIQNRISPERWLEPRPGEQLGRWPANVCHDNSDEVLAAYPDSAGQLRATGPEFGKKYSRGIYGDYGPIVAHEPRGDGGSAARFFFSAKADKEDRWGSKHPTVKPIDLIRWLQRLVTPPGGLVLDPFAGSGTAGVAALAEGFDAILIEREPEYIADIEARLAHYRGEGRHSLAAKNRSRAAAPTGDDLFAAPDGNSEAA